MNNNKKKVIIATTIVIVFVVVVIMSQLSKKNEVVVPSGDNSNTATGRNNVSATLPREGSGEENVQEPEALNNGQATVSSEDIDRKQAENRAKFFVEMLGSYSSDANFKNIIDLQPMMTEDMVDWSNDFIERNSGGSVDESVTTYALKTRVLNYTYSEVQFVVSTRREKETNGVSKLYNQDAEVTLVKSKDEWKIGAIEWR